MEEKKQKRVPVKPASLISGYYFHWVDCRLPSDVRRLPGINLY